MKKGKKTYRGNTASLGSYLFVQFQPSLVTFSIHVLQSKVPDFTQADGFYHLCETERASRKTELVFFFHFYFAEGDTLRFGHSF